MSFAQQLKIEANRTRTMNGAGSWRSTGDACLDLFSVAGGMRWRGEKDQIRLFERAYIESPDLAMKLLFHIRDIRGGMGERRMFRTLLAHTARIWPASARRNVQYVAEFGRWDDLLCLLDTPACTEAVSVISRQLEDDLAALARRGNGDCSAHISLLAKWLPSDNASSRRTRAMAAKLMRLLDMDARTYRKTLTRLRAAISLTERRLTANQADRINYEAVPAGAMLKYRKAFRRQDGERFGQYVRDVAACEKSMHADALFPYQILRPFFGEMTFRREAEGADVLDVLWDSMSGEVGNANALSVIDTSGSMYWTRPGVPMVPALVSQAMGLYCAERCRGLFHNTYITFSRYPTLMTVRGDNLADKLRYLSTAPWGGNTDLMAVFDLILRTAVKARAPQEEMPSVLYIFSDMEFDRAVTDPDRTVFEAAEEKFRAAGYRLPAVVFHNVNSWKMHAPVTAHTRGAALTSGAGVSAVKEHFSGNVTPMSHMLRVLNAPRYACIQA